MIYKTTDQIKVSYHSLSINKFLAKKARSIKQSAKFVQQKNKAKFKNHEAKSIS